ncbi:PFA5 [Candida jiufengensis]|uniref:PFA5 n=1 Tax=Candida jiufengensis TaxID=497108 RepID=UPI0022240B64|nr:PFA5 [Candida jiufengensis]KAI5956495.1 PFA5 [Candida jiufengensis]
MTAVTNKLAKYNKLVVPIGIVFGLAYLNFALNYSLGYKEVYKHHSNSIAIILWCLSGFCQICIFVYWFLILYVGPGKSPKFPQLNLYNNTDSVDELLPVPDVFLCDEFGFPQYDSHTQSIKTDRSFYSKNLEYIVLKYDHHCLWVGKSIGLTNYVYFMKFCFWFLSLFIIMLIYTACYTRSSISRGEINHNFIIMYIACGLWLPMILALYISHLRYICLNMTTLDDITLGQRKRYERYKERRQSETTNPCLNPRKPRKEKGIRYVSVKKDNFRLIVKYDIKERPFDMGWRRNWINLMFNGNRNHGRSDSYYTNTKLILSIILFLCPFIEIPVEMRYRQRQSHQFDVENYPKSIERTIAEYDWFSSKYNSAFLTRIQTKVDEKDCYIPSYLVGKEL